MNVRQHFASESVRAVGRRGVDNDVANNTPNRRGRVAEEVLTSVTSRRGHSSNAPTCWCLKKCLDFRQGVQSKKIEKKRPLGSRGARGTHAPPGAEGQSWQHIPKGIHGATSHGRHGQASGKGREFCLWNVPLFRLGSACPALPQTSAALGLGVGVTPDDKLGARRPLPCRPQTTSPWYPENKCSGFRCFT